MKKITLNIAGLFMFIILSASVLAAPGVPHQFYGSVLVNGAPAPNNLIIEAKIDGATYSTITLNNQFGYDPIFYVEDPDDNRQGKKVVFFIEGVKATEYTFSNGFVTKLDLSAINVNIPDSGTGSGDSGSGSTSGTGGSGSSVSSTGGSSGSPIIIDTGSESDTNNDNVITLGSGSCEPVWVCSEWTDCANNQQRRVCVDRNECDNEVTRPEEQRSCEMTVEEIYGSAPGEEPNRGIISSFTGFVTGLGNGNFSLVPLLVLLVVIAGLFILFFFFRKTKESKKSKKKK